MALSNWDKKAQATFAKIMEIIPEPLKETMKPKLIDMIENKAAGSAVTVEVIERLVREDLPEPQRSVIMNTLGLSDTAPKKAEAKAAETVQLTWEGESEKMVEKILGIIPEMLRGAVRPKLLDFIKTKAGPSGVVTDNLVVSAIQEMKPPEPYMSQIMKALSEGTGVDLSKVDGILSAHQRRQEELLPILHKLQREYRHLPKGALDKVSGYLNLPLSRVYRVVTSYQAFSLEPKAKHLVKVCSGVACYLKQSDKLYEELKSSADNRFSLEKVRCTGCCGLAPSVVVDEECGDSTWAKEKIAQF